MENFPSNSYSSSEKRPERKKVERVTISEAQRRKKPLGRKVAETFTADDTHSVGHYILFEVLIPAGKNRVSDAVSQGVERLLFGDSARPTSSPRKGNYVPYHRTPVRGSAQTSGSRDISPKARGSHVFDEVLLESRGEAEEVLERLTDLIKDYDHATVSDMYDLVGITGSFTDDRWGWTNLRGAGVRRVRDGYILDLPKTSPID